MAKRSILHPVQRKRTAAADETSISMRLGILAVVVLVLFSVLGFRLWFLQILSGEKYVVLADNNRLRKVDIEAPRGVIYDRDGKVLVGNRAGLSVGILPMELSSEDTVVPRLADLLEMPEQEIRDALAEAKKDPYRVMVIKEDVPEKTVATYLKEHSLEFPGIKVEQNYLRAYPRDSFATHLLGYVGRVSPEDLEEDRFKGLPAEARVGKDGVERTYDNYLRGQNGETTVEVDHLGRPIELKERVNPIPGENLVLTVDYDLQDAAERAVKEGIERAHADGFKDATAGAVVAMDPNNGEILALTSYPDYPLSLWAAGMKRQDFERLDSDEGHPFVNRVIKGLYPAASTFKPFVAATALSTDTISWDKVFYDGGSFRIGQQKWDCWDEDGHGEVNLVEALMESCDTYFYNIGKMMWEQEGPVLQEGLRKFGFGTATGIDLPGEQKGRVPDATWKAKYFKSDEDKAWKPGDDVNLAIGQGDLLVTPLQLATAFSAIANGREQQTTGAGAGTSRLDLFIPHLAMEIQDAAGNVKHEFDSELQGYIEMNSEDLDAIRRGLLAVTEKPDGTAYGAFRGFPVSVAGKTGTAQKKPYDDYAWFMGYAPADNPEILVVALIEQGGHGSSVAAPVVRRVMESYFNVERGGEEQIEMSE